MADPNWDDLQLFHVVAELGGLSAAAQRTGLSAPTIGRRMLAHLEDRVRGLGYTTVVLDTHDSLTEAITMYERAGYRSIERW